ncbi:MAG TPA: hypothetical protein VFN67_33200 [Polyangiales bacterium]|nr:hypothetical protein [Polyangiales bacterium]
MQNTAGWIWFASSLLLACNNSAPLADSAESVSSDVRERACEVAEPSDPVYPEETRGLYAAGERKTGVLSAYADSCMSGRYALQVDLDVFMQDDPVAAEHDPGRGRASLVLRADVTTNEVELRLCGLTLPPRYVYATSGVTQLDVADETWDRPSMPTWKSRVSTERAEQLEIEPFPLLLGIALPDPGASWPSFEQTPAFACGMERAGSACFPDHDGDGEPGMSLQVQTAGDAIDAPYPACDDWHFAAPSTQPEAWFSGARGGAEPSRVFVGLRTALQLFPRFDETCTQAEGSVQAADIVTRVLDCELADGQRCSPAEATVLDARAPSFHVLVAGEVPPETFGDSRRFVDEALDRSASTGGKLRMQRLPDEAADTCTPVRAVFAR